MKDHGKRWTASGPSAPTAPASRASIRAPWPWRSGDTSSGARTARPSRWKPGAATLKPGLNLVGGQNIAQRWYLGDNQGQNVDYGAGATENITGTFPLRWYDNRNNAWTSTPVTIEEVLNSGAGARDGEGRSVERGGAVVHRHDH